MPTNPLVLQRCQALEGHAPMAPALITQHLAAAPGWVEVGGAIQKRFAFKDFHHTMAFVNAVAWIANVEDHHPDLTLSYGHCTVRFNTHSVGGVSLNDFICAAKVDALLAPTTDAPVAPTASAP